MREQNALLAKAFKQDRPIAKDDVDNVGAGRAAKGANHFAPATKKGIPSGMPFFVCCEAKGENPDLSGGRARKQARGIP